VGDEDGVVAPGPNTRVYHPTAGETIADAIQATEDDIREVLEDVSRLEIRGELRNSEKEYVWIDDIVLGPPDGSGG